MSGINTIIGDFKSMKEKQKQFEEILLGTTVPEKTPAKEVKSKGKFKSSKEDIEDIEDHKSRSGKSKKSQDSSDSNNDNDSSSSSSSSSSSEDGSDPDLDPDDLFVEISLERRTSFSLLIR